MERYRVLVFSYTNGYRHASIEDGVALVRALGEEHGFGVDATENNAVFTQETLAPYAAVIFMNTNGDVLESHQEAEFERYIRNGGGYVGVHSAAATEYDWPWYQGLVGAHFDNHPVPQDAEVLVLDRVHPSTVHLPQRWERFDEWYNYRTNPRGDVHVLATLKETSYEGGEMGHDHPIVWAHEYDGGRSWYTGLGHTREAYADEDFQQHLLGGIEWASGAQEGDAGATVGAHYEKVVLMDEVTNPMEIAIAEDGRVFLVERAGAVKMWDPATEKTSLIGWIPVYMVIEDGLLGVALDPDFSDNGWMYVFYAPADAGPSRLSRFSIFDNTLAMDSEKVLLEVPVQRKVCCHAGGSIAFDASGNLYLSTGDNTDVLDEQGAPLQGNPIDEREGRRWADAQRSSANTNDLRGKILRIRPMPDGTYTIPEGNLFEGDALHRPEIYTMGHRNPFRIAVDHETGWLYWGDVGQGGAPNDRGGWGWDEFNQAKGPGNFGWPQFAGPEAYNQYDYTTKTVGDPFDAAAPVNDSPNNTGAKTLPPAQDAWIWYTYGQSEHFPELGAGGVNPMAGPIYRKPENPAPYALPDYYIGTPILYEWMRNWVKEAKVDANGEVLEISPFLPGIEFVRPMDMEIGPDGALYVAEWGDEFWGSNQNAQVSRIEYHGGKQGTFHGGAGAEDIQPSNPIMIGFTSPLDGGFFEFDEPVSYELMVKAPGGEQVDMSRLRVTAYTGFDTYALPLEEQQTMAGAFAITHAYTHTPDMHFMDRFARLEACYTSLEGEEQCTQVKLHPMVKEAEHASWRSGGARRMHGTHPASEMYPITAMTTIQLQAGDTLAYAPMNLSGIASVTVRYKQHAAGELVVQHGDGETVRISLDGAQSEPVASIAQIERAEYAIQHDKALYVDTFDRDAYEGWSEATVSVPQGTGALLLWAESEANGAVVEVDWVGFNR